MMQGTAELSELFKVAANGSGVAIFALYIVYKEVLIPRRAKANGANGKQPDGYVNGISPLLMEKLNNFGESLERIEKATSEARDKSIEALTKAEALALRCNEHFYWDGQQERRRLRP